VITLNYDCVFEYAHEEIGNAAVTQRLAFLDQVISASMGESIWRREAQPSTRVALGAVKGGRFIKLHGSVNWVHCPNPDCLGRHLIQAVEDAASSHPPRNDYLLICRHCGTNLERLIVPPHARKAHGSGRLSLLWRFAFEEVFAADRIVVWGVSFAVSDYDVRWLLGEAMRQRRAFDKSTSVVVVNPDDDAEKRVRRMFAKDVVRFSNMAEYLEHERENA
jgi:hypothetical protein